MSWQAWDAARKTREAWKDAKERWRREREEDWSGLSEEEVKRKLVERNVIIPEVHDKGEKENDVEKAKDCEQIMRYRVRCSEGFLEVCRKCLESQSEN